MPSFYDNTYHNTYRKPVYDRDEDRVAREHKRVNEEIYELAPTPLPTQEMENEYMDFLQDDLMSDPWVTYRFRKHMASPKRIPWKNQYKIKKQYQSMFLMNWIIGGALFWPAACIIGRRAKRYQSGVAIVPYQRFIHNFPDVDPTALSKKTFRYYSAFSAIGFGYFFAHMTTDKRALYNTWYNRPDLKPYPAMVAQDPEEADKMHEVKLAHYQDYQK